MTNYGRPPEPHEQPAFQHARLIAFDRAYEARRNPPSDTTCQVHYWSDGGRIQCSGWPTYTAVVICTGSQIERPTLVCEDCVLLLRTEQIHCHRLCWPGVPGKHLCIAVEIALAQPRSYWRPEWQQPPEPQ